MRLKERDHGQEEGEVSDKSTIFAARNITLNYHHAIKERLVWNKYFDSGPTFGTISDFFDVALCLFSAMLCLLPVFCAF